MAIKVFISWSGELSCKLAEEIHNWLPNVLQAVKPYFTPNDLEKGVKWDSEISKELDASQIGLLCLTRDNMDNPWILFEAGALSKKIDKSRVCPILFGLGPTDLKGPLTSFQTTKFIKDDFKKLVSTINNSSEELKLQPRNLDEVFEMWWPTLEERIKDIFASQKKGPIKGPRTEMDILIEILEITRMLAKTQKPFEVDLRGLVPSAAFNPEWASRLSTSLGEMSKRCNAESGKTVEAIKSIVGQYYSALPAEEQVSKPPKPDKKE